MKILCLGGGGRICRESILDLVRFSDFDRITVADVDCEAGEEVAAWLDDRRVDFVTVDARDREATIAAMAQYDLVMDGTPISMNDLTTECIARAGVHGIKLNGMSREWDFDGLFCRNGKTHVPGFGLYGYALHVEVIGMKGGRPVQHVLTHTHPRSDGSVEDWAGLRAYTRCVGIPMSIGAQLIAKGAAKRVGAVAPELAFSPEDVFEELERRDILIHEVVSDLGDGVT